MKQFSVLFYSQWGLIVRGLQHMALHVSSSVDIKPKLMSGPSSFCCMHYSVSNDIMVDERNIQYRQCLESCRSCVQYKAMPTELDLAKNAEVHSVHSISQSINCFAILPFSALKYSRNEWRLTEYHKKKTALFFIDCHEMVLYVTAKHWTSVMLISAQMSLWSRKQFRRRTALAGWYMEKESRNKIMFILNFNRL